MTDKLDISGIDDVTADHIRKFVSLFKHRDETYVKITAELFLLIQENILSTFVELIQLPEDRIKWLDLQVDMEEDQGVLIISFTLEYSKQEANKFVLKNFGYIVEQDVNVRLVKFGIPLYFIFAPKEEFLEFVLKITDSVKEDFGEEVQIDAVSFDTSTLTSQQLAQLSLFNSKGSIH